MGQGRVRVRRNTKSTIATAASRNIRSLREKTVKLVLYGTGEGGKTTILRQMTLAQGNEIHELANFRAGILFNVVEGALTTLKAGEQLFNKDFSENLDAQLLRQKYAGDGGRLNVAKITLSKASAKAILNLYEDEDFQQVLEHKSEYQLADGWRYFIEKLKEPGFPEWGGPAWSPSNDDLLRSRIRTTGKKSLIFDSDKAKFELIDTGGQKSERRKWQSVLAGCDAMLFVASLCEYDQTLYEDHITNRLSESIKLWEKMANEESLENTWIILILNKTDLLKEKFIDRKVSIKPDFEVHAPAPTPEEDDEHCTQVKQWFHDLFMSKVHEHRKSQVNVFFTNAMDRENIDTTIKECAKILSKNVDKSEFG